MNIHGLPEYISHKWSFGFPTLIVLVSPIYMVPTVWIICKMFHLYFTTVSKNKSSAIQKHLFLSFLLMQLGNLSYFLTDCIVLRIPATGILTSICAQMKPNQLLMVPYLIAFISSYCSMLYPVLFCLNRAIIVFRPKDHTEICSKMMRIGIPLTIVVPLGLTAFMIPSSGFCYQLPSPYPMGAIMFLLYDYTSSINEFSHLLTSFTCTFLAFTINISMMIKVRRILFNKTVSTRQNKRNYRAELSLTITMISLFVPFLINGIVAILVLKDPTLTSYVIAIRPLAIDTVTVFIPVAFYYTHPIFRSKQSVQKTSVVMTSTTKT